ncbi:hypothetical protein QR685DRAFT_66157 [Neurospora intermedia]|uniref:Uncharacterized protein n=1 Tax=Neurospora intermedia TaxID=5142 RepID=A0ABR3DTQ9_NEUIN
MLGMILFPVRSCDIFQAPVISINSVTKPPSLTISSICNHLHPAWSLPPLYPIPKSSMSYYPLENPESPWRSRPFARILKHPFPFVKHLMHKRNRSKSLLVPSSSPTIVSLLLSGPVYLTYTCSSSPCQHNIDPIVSGNTEPYSRYSIHGIAPSREKRQPKEVFLSKPVDKLPNKPRKKVACNFQCMLPIPHSFFSSPFPL